MKKFVPVLLFLLFVLMTLYYIQEKVWRISDFLMIESRSPRNAQQFTFEDNFLTKEECAKLSSFIQQHPRMAESDLGDQFKGTYGFQFTFRDASVKYDVKNLKKMTNVELEPIYDLYKKIKIPGTNACLFNPLLINTSTDPNVEGSTANPHYDVTLGVSRFTRRVTPVYTTVIYIEVPDEFEWGRLAVSKLCKSQSDNFVYIRPKVGRKVTFRGDSYHFVEPMFSKTPQKRISLVFEQYKLTAEEIDKYAQIDIV